LAPNQSFLARNDFWLRKLHSLSGVAPIGVFMMVHLVTNASLVWGLANRKYAETGHAGVITYQHEVNFIHSLPALLLIEVFGLWLPIAFHAILGVYYATQARPNNAHYKYAANWRYTLQRISAWAGLLFIFYHVATLRWGWTFLVPGGTKWSADHAASTLVAALHGSTEGVTGLGLLIAVLYMAGVSMLVFHLANGLWTAAITWGITLSAAAQKRWGYACAAIGAGLMLAAWSAVLGVYLLDYDRARSTEDAFHGHHHPPMATDGELVLNLPDGAH
jgi:succinate dehydrogenase / fumarate reductase cytochrome b subunit